MSLLPLLKKIQTARLLLSCRFTELLENPTILSNYRLQYKLFLLNSARKHERLSTGNIHILKICYKEIYKKVFYEVVIRDFHMRHKLSMFLLSQKPKEREKSKVKKRKKLAKEKRLKQLWSEET